MKYINYKSILATVFIFLIDAVELFAKNMPPAPKGGEGTDSGGVVGDVPIDDYLPLLFIMAILLGVWVINKYNSSEIT